MSIDATSTFDVWNGNPVYIDYLTGSGTVTLSINTGVNWAGARNLTVGVNNGSGSFSGVIAGNSSRDGGTLSLTGTVVNSGTMQFTGGAQISATSALFINNGFLDLMTAAPALPAHFINNGVVLDRSQVRVWQTIVTGTDFKVSIQGYTGHSYQLQRTDSIGAGSNWLSLGSAQAGAGQQITFADSGGVSGASRFYRILVSP